MPTVRALISPIVQLYGRLFVCFTLYHYHMSSGVPFVCVAKNDMMQMPRNMELIPFPDTTLQ